MTVPRETIAVPHGTTTVPRETTTVPHGTTTVLQGTMTVPHGTTIVPRETMTVPHVTEVVPCETEVVPDMFEAMLHEIETQALSPVAAARETEHRPLGTLHGDDPPRRARQAVTAAPSPAAYWFWNRFVTCCRYPAYQLTMR